MALRDIFKRKKKVVKEDDVDLLEDLFDEPIKYIPNEDLKSKLIDSLIDLNECHKRELKSLERIEELRRLNISLEIENKMLKIEIEDLKKEDHLDPKSIILNDDDNDKKEDHLDPKSKDVILNNDEDKEEYLDSKSMILKLLKGKDRNIYINPRFKIGFNVLKLSQDTNLSKFTIYKYLRKIREDIL